MAEGDPVRGLERNLRVLSWLLPLSRVYFWTPVFFLYLSDRFEVAQVLRLEAIYYLVVVLLEVPSGYLSDRVGRRVTLVVSGMAMTAAYLLFLTGGTSFTLFALAQAAQAVGYAFLSGTDAAIHYDTLAALGRAESFAEREARVARNGFWGASAAALLAGAAGMLDLRIPYALSAVNAVVLFGLACALVEPPRVAGGFATRSFVHQLGACLGYLRSPYLLWLYGYFVLKITMEHVPYEFAQPYLAIVLGETLDALRYTPLASGVLVAGIAFVASLAAARSVALRDRLGLGGALLLVGAIQLGLIAGMGAFFSPWIVPLVFLRSVQAAVSNPLITAAVAPVVGQDVRATYLSLHSLSGRLGYSLVLFSLSALVGAGSADDPPVLATLLRASAVLSAAGLLVFASARGALRSAPSDPATA